ncbi:hypothetical protein V8E51_006485 [Hyaloscypha variabilis]
MIRLRCGAAQVDVDGDSLGPQSGEDDISDPHCSSETRDAIHELHQALQSSWPACSKPPHLAMLRLVASCEQSKPKKGQKCENLTGREFDVALSAHCQSWVENKFVISEQVAPRSREVRFSDETEDFSESKTPFDVCGLIQSSATKGTYVRVTVSSKILQSQNKIRGRTGLFTSKPRIPLVPLIRAMETKNSGNIFRRSPVLKGEHKAILAVIFAYSLWHLIRRSDMCDDVWNEGPWLAKRLDEGALFFLRTTDQHVDIGRPYLVTDFDQNDNFSDDCPHPSPAVFSFAMILIYLYCADEFLSLRENIVSLEGREIPNTDYFAAVKLLDEPGFKQDVQSVYRKVITACLVGELVDDLAGMDEPIIQRSFLQQVVVPLKEELEHSWKLSPDALHEEFKVEIPNDFLEDKDHACAISSGHARALGKYRPAEAAENKFNDEATPSKVVFFHDHHKTDAALLPLAKTWLNDADNHLRKFINKPEQKIKVAVFDTGVNTRNPILLDYRKRIKFLNGDEASNNDIDGHGTLVVYLLLRLARNVEVYVSKISGTREFEMTQTGMESLAHIITDAASDINNKIDIMNLSFGFENSNDRLLEPVRQALMKAHISHNIIILAAARNDGGSKPVAWPASMTEHVICVHSSDGEGNPSVKNPSHDELKICTLGDGFEVRVSESEVWVASGTSFATPVAAALVATILGIDLHHRRGLNEDQIHQLEKKLRSRAGMMKVLTERCIEKSWAKRSGFCYVTPAFFLKHDDVMQRILDSLERVSW